jgi:hypothetical protein
MNNMKTTRSKRSIHLDPVGGMAGDMFIAAVLDAFPELRDGMMASIRAAGLPPAIGLELEGHRDHALTGLIFAISEAQCDGGNGHHHRTFSDIRRQLQNSALAGDVCLGAVAMFTLLAQAEARVHGMSVEEVSFHELGEWDSIADIVGAAFLICELDATWSVGPLPLGGGRVDTAHGSLPVPAPATALLLEGFSCFDDGISGERVTPTGAVILRHLGANRTRDMVARELCGSGTGFGSRKMPGLSNVLRLLVFQDMGPGREDQDRIAEILFEVDDQTPEDLALGLDRLRSHTAVRDVLQVPAFGKKGRMTTHVRVLADPLQVRQVCDVCLEQTTTIGLRYQILDRVTLQRREQALDLDGRSIAVKAVMRSAGATVKAEADDIAGVPGGYAARDRVRRLAEDMFRSGGGDAEGSQSSSDN